jgi:hypothetical protein
MWLEGLRHLKKFNDLIGTRNRDLQAYSILPQPTTLPRALCIQVLGSSLNLGDYSAVVKVLTVVLSSGM